MTDDPFDLARFVTAQEAVIDRAMAELAAGTKHSHWMWFVFPQIAGLGYSPTAQRYAIKSLEEAAAYLAHPLLGRRLREATTLVLRHDETALKAIFGSPDDMKFRSSMTLFAHIESEPFERALQRFCDGEHDAATLQRIG